MIDRYLSIWEIAHRWRDINSDKSDPADLPLSIQDTISYICRGALDGNLAIYYMVTLLPGGKNNSSETSSKIMPYQVKEMPFEIEDALDRKYDKETLDAYFVEAENLFEYCLKEQGIESQSKNSTVDFPGCWSHFNGDTDISESESDDSESLTVASPQALRPMQIDKLVCQAIAKTLWDEYSQMTITAMTKHNAIQEYGNGKCYIGNNTLRDWLSEVAPDSVRKPGTSKSSKSSNSAD